MSRSLVVILACLAVGLSIRASVEFAFLLGLVTLGAATLYETLGEGAAIVDQFGLAAPLGSSPPRSSRPPRRWC